MKKHVLFYTKALGSLIGEREREREWNIMFIYV